MDAYSKSNLVSIITPAYNSAAFIAQTIDSIRAQTHTEWELLITDDCSTDDTCIIVDRYCLEDERIKLFRLPENSGAGVARNHSIREAKGRYIAFCDSDDLWKPDKLEKQIEFMRRNNHTFVFCQTEVIDADGTLVGFSKRKPRVSFRSETILNFIGTSSVIYDTKEIGKFYMKPIRRRQDWVLWLDILKVTRHAYCLEEALSIYRNSGSASLSANKFKLFKYHTEIYYEYLGYSVLRSYLTFYCLSLPCILAKKLYNKYYGAKYLKHINKALQ